MQTERDSANNLNIKLSHNLISCNKLYLDECRRKHLLFEIYYISFDDIEWKVSKVNNVKNG